MPDLTGARKMEVFDEIERLPAKEKERAHKLYAILDKIEWLTIAPFSFGLLTIFALPFLAVFMDGKLPIGEDTMLLYGLGGAALFYVKLGGTTLFYLANAIVLKKLVFDPRRNGVVEQLRTMLLSDHKYRSTLETLKQIDPAIVVNIRKYIAQATYGA